MSWILDSSLTSFQKFCINVIKCGPVPNHIAFIMDGNRRYAKKTNVQKAQGHSKGFDKLAECLQWCKELGIKEVTVYAFSIENFKRQKDEVDALMHLAKEKFQKLFEEKDKLMSEGVCIRAIGNLSLLPVDIRKLIAEAVLLTKDNNKAILNVAFSYTSRDEIANSIKTIVDGIDQNRIQIDDINEELISQCLYTNMSHNPDILIRTSGEIRLSDFLLWQIFNTEICFTNVLWPEFSIWHLLACVIKYQRGYKDLKQIFNTEIDSTMLWPEFSIWHLLACIFKYQRGWKELRQHDVDYKNNDKVNFRVKCFLEDLQQKRYAQLETYAKS